MKTPKKATKKLRSLKPKQVPTSRDGVTKGGSVSNVLKLRHDTAKNSISNVR